MVVRREHIQQDSCIFFLNFFFSASWRATEFQSIRFSGAMAGFGPVSNLKHMRVLIENLHAYCLASELFRDPSTVGPRHHKCALSFFECDVVTFHRRPDIDGMQRVLETLLAQSWGDL